MNIQKKLISNNYTGGREGRTPQFVIVHTYAGAGTDLQGWFNNPSAKVSAHYSVLFSGEVFQYVEEKDTAWHAGKWDANLISIGIEHQDNGNPDNSTRSPELYESSAQLIADIYRRYNWDKANMGLIKPHYEYAPTRSCPAGLNLSRVRNRVSELLNPPVVGDNYRAMYEELKATHDKTNERLADVEAQNTSLQEKLKQYSIEIQELRDINSALHDSLTKCNEQRDELLKESGNVEQFNLIKYIISLFSKK